jgi:hypothetical protein
MAGKKTLVTGLTFSDRKSTRRGEINQHKTKYLKQRYVSFTSLHGNKRDLTTSVSLIEWNQGSISLECHRSALSFFVLRMLEELLSVMTTATGKIKLRRDRRGQDK